MWCCTYCSFNCYREWNFHTSGRTAGVYSWRARSQKRPEALCSSQTVIHPARTCTESQEICLWAEHQKCPGQTDNCPSTTGRWKFMLKLLHVLLSYLRLKFRNMIGSGLMTCDTLYVVIQGSWLFYMSLAKHHDAVIWKLYKIFSLHILIAISEISWWMWWFNVMIFQQFKTSSIALHLCEAYTVVIYFKRSQGWLKN